MASNGCLKVEVKPQVDDMTSSPPDAPKADQQNGSRLPGPPKLAYMHSPPRIMPNYGSKLKKKSLLPKTKVSRVLLYDNITQQQMLDMKLSHIRLEKHRASRLLDLHKRSFIFRQKKRQHQLQQAGLVLPDINEKSSKLPARTPSNHSKRALSSFQGHRSAMSFDFETLKLPEISNVEKTSNVPPRVIFSFKDADGTTQIFHTIDDGGLFSEFVPKHKFYDKTTEDPRFRGLEGSLIKSEIEQDGFNELSPSFNKKYPELPEHLTEYIANLDLRASL